MLGVTATATAVALATGLGAIPVWLLSENHPLLRPALWGVAAGTMGTAAVLGLLAPALEDGAPASVAAGLVAGGALVVASRSLLRGPRFRFAEAEGADAARSARVFGVLAVHSLPEGIAVGTAFASQRTGLPLFVAAAMALQNIPEGTSVALPMQAAGIRRIRQLEAAVASSAAQPVGAAFAFAFVETARSMLAFSFAVAGGAMVTLVVSDLAPEAFRRPGRQAGLAGALGGAASMACLAAVAGV